MKTMKWICRYAFLTLLLGLCVAFCLYCNATVQALDAQVGSISYVDLALESIGRAYEVLDRIDHYEYLLQNGILVTLLVAAALVLLILWHIFGDKLIQKLKAPKPAKPEKPVQPVQVELPRQVPYFCPFCGARHETKPAFCGSCGKALEE